MYTTNTSGHNQCIANNFIDSAVISVIYESTHSWKMSNSCTQLSIYYKQGVHNLILANTCIPQTFHKKVTYIFCQTPSYIRGKQPFIVY